MGSADSLLRCMKRGDTLISIAEYEKAFLGWLVPGFASFVEKRRIIIRYSFYLWLSFILLGLPAIIWWSGQEQGVLLFLFIFGVQCGLILLEKLFPAQNIFIDLLLGSIPPLFYALTTKSLFNESLLLWFILYPLVSASTMSLSRTILWTGVSIFFPHLMVYYFDPDKFFGIYSLNLTLIIMTMAIIAVVFRLILNKLNTDLEERALRYQSMFRMVCHDVANPLAIIKFNLGRLEKKLDTSLLTPDLQKYIMKAGKSAEIMMRILEEIRTYDALNTGKKSMNLEAFRLDLIWKNISILFEDILHEKNVTLSLPKDQGLFILADESGFQNQIMANLISNAIKFSLPGQSVRIMTAADNDFVKIMVKDEGKGMPQDLLDHLFDPLAKTNRTGTAGEVGTGFGMPIVQSWVKAMEGEIAVTSKEDHGTVVVLKMKRVKEERVSSPMTDSMKISA